MVTIGWSVKHPVSYHQLSAQSLLVSTWYTIITCRLPKVSLAKVSSNFAAVLHGQKSKFILIFSARCCKPSKFRLQFQFYKSNSDMEYKARVLHEKNVKINKLVDSLSFISHKYWSTPRSFVKILQLREHQQYFFNLFGSTTLVSLLSASPEQYRVQKFHKFLRLIQMFNTCK